MRDVIPVIQKFPLPILRHCALRKDPNLAEPRFRHFHLVPSGVRGNLIPERKMPDEEQRAASGVFPGIAQVGIQHNLAQLLLILLKDGTMKIAFEKFGDDFIFRYFADQPGGAEGPRVLRGIGPGERSNEERQRHQDQQDLIRTSCTRITWRSEE